MKVKVPVIVKDPKVIKYKEIEPTEEQTIEEDLFLDGPISPRVAILDFDPVTGVLAPGLRLEAPPGPGETASYRFEGAFDSDVSAQAAAVSAFGAVYKALGMFEEEDALGRRVAWAFDAPQLLVVPRAGTEANAYYDRDSHSLQFFRFQNEVGEMIHTVHSQDIIAHETAHAVLDGVAPDLLEAISPQARAIHEAVADLTALLCSFRCRELGARILEATEGSLDHPTAFSGLAWQFAAALQQGRRSLREMNNKKSLRRDAPPEDCVDPEDPYALSEVLSGAFYRVLVELYDALREQFRTDRAPDPELVAGPEKEYVQKEYVQKRVAWRIFQPTDERRALALFVASERLKRTIFRGLDYLPPGEVSFADFARAVLASDEASHPESKRQRRSLVKEFQKRGIAANPQELEVRTNFDHEALQGLSLDDLVKSDYVAYSFVEEHRGLLGVPSDVAFAVRPRLDVTKRYWHRSGPKPERECLLKVAWTEIEENVSSERLPPQRRCRAGSTLALTWSDPPRVRALLRTQRRPIDREATDAFLLRLLEDGQLHAGKTTRGPVALPLRGIVAADPIDGALRVKETGRSVEADRPGTEPGGGEPAAARSAPHAASPTPPPGVDLGAFLNLVEKRRSGNA